MHNLKYGRVVISCDKILLFYRYIHTVPFLKDGYEVTTS